MKMIDFVGHKRIYFTISLILIFVTFAVTAILGVEVAIEFKGGTMINYSYDGTVDVNEFQTKVEEIISSKVDITQGEDFTTDKKTIKVSLVSDEGLTADKQFELSNSLQETFAENNLTLLSSSDVNPSSGHDFFSKCLVAVAFALIVLILYIAWRFKRISGWSAGVVAIIALLHDIIMVYGTFAIFRIPLDANFIAVVLTIFGYSINDTIVIYDRIRENKHILGKNISRTELVNTSINQSLTRSINTSVCTIVAMIVVSIVALCFNVTSILSFSFPLIIGMITGVYSTVCIAGPLWVWWEDRREQKHSKMSKKAAKA